MAAATIAVFSLAVLVEADVPYPKPDGSVDPRDYSQYLFWKSGVFPNDYSINSGDAWKYGQTTGLNILNAWLYTTGRPDVVSAVLDSGIRWDNIDIVAKVALNTGELPLPPGCSSYDCDNNGVINVHDFSGVADQNGNGFVDGQDLIRLYSNGVDDDGNGYIDDIAGWDFFENDNDPDDDTGFNHGSNRAIDQVGEANNGIGFPGVAPSAMFVPIRVSDSFIVADSDFTQGVVYAVDLGLSLISVALGSITVSPSAQGAVDYAYWRGIPVIASAADEQSRHNNYPAALEHTIWVNSIRNGDGAIIQNTNDYTILNGCTNYGPNAWISIPSTGCSSEAVGRASGLTALLISHAKNLVDRGRMQPYPGLSAPLSAQEIRQLLRQSSQDINHSADPDLDMPFLLWAILRDFDSEHFPTQAGWDQYTGYGRPNAVTLLTLLPDKIPPEADLSGGLDWFATVDPSRTSQVPIIGSARAVRASSFTYTVECGCGVQPTQFELIASGNSVEALDDALLGYWDPAATARRCNFDPSARMHGPEDHSVTLRFRVTDDRGNTGEDRRVVAIHSDSSLKVSPIRLGGSAESSPKLADVNRDGVLDILLGTGDGQVQVRSGITGELLLGFPVFTDPIPVHPSPAYDTGAVPPPRENILASLAADDLDGDGRTEIVAASMEGKIYVWDDHGRLRPGFPVSTNPVFSAPGQRNRFNDSDPAIAGAPTLVNLDGVAETKLEIVVAAWDGHIYAWRSDGSPVDGFPVRLADRGKVDVDDSTGTVTVLDGTSLGDRPAKITASPAVADIDDDGFPEIIVGTSEEYAGEIHRYDVDEKFQEIINRARDVLRPDVAGRLYAIRHDGHHASRGPLALGWPAPVPLMLPGVLPIVGTGIPGSPAVAKIGPAQQYAVAIFGAAGPVVMYDSQGSFFHGTNTRGFVHVLIDNSGTAISGDSPFLAFLGSGAFGDINGDGRPEYVAPTAGIRALLDIALPGKQELSDFQVAAWDPYSRWLVPPFPVIMDDMSFLTSPVLADVDGDERADVVIGSGGYLLRAFRSDGSQPSGWPKFTFGWLLASPAAGDVDGDGKIEVVAATREGNLYIWDTPALASETSLPWPGMGRDRRNTQNLNSGVSSLAEPRTLLDALEWMAEAQRIEGLRVKRIRREARGLRAARP
ncbi:MAG TPA: FG-GAP-like repeat-containing protein [Acidobacteriota bacterium]|nr:FG-GAP-like repeat-containing protein [Acidobacteriota bacterium]